MELKELILQTINEFDSKEPKSELPPSSPNSTLQIDSRFLELLREKTLVLFEGLQSSQTKDLSAKLDLVLNYLQYQLALIDEALQQQP